MKTKQRQKEKCITMTLNRFTFYLPRVFIVTVCFCLIFMARQLHALSMHRRLQQNTRESLKIECKKGRKEEEKKSQMKLRWSINHKRIMPLCLEMRNMMRIRDRDVAYRCFPFDERHDIIHRQDAVVRLKVKCRRSRATHTRQWKLKIKRFRRMNARLNMMWINQLIGSIDRTENFHKNCK